MSQQWLRVMSSHPFSRGHMMPRDQLQSFYLFFQKTYKHQIWHIGGLSLFIVRYNQSILCGKMYVAWQNDKISTSYLHFHKTYKASNLAQKWLNVREFHSQSYITFAHVVICCHVCDIRHVLSPPLQDPLLTNLVAW